MSTLQKEIMAEAEGITNETRVCGITQQRIGGLYTKIGTELGNINNALGNDANFSSTMNNALTKKANKTETIVSLPQTGSSIPLAYYRQLSTWYSSTGGGEARGRYLNLGDADRDYQLRFIADRGNGPELHYRAGTNGSSIGQVEILHTGNTAQTVIAGNIDGTAYTSYIGNDCTISLTGSKYRITHNLNTEYYLVTITPINSTARSFSVATKEPNYLEIQFSAVTPFDIQILKYEY